MSEETNDIGSDITQFCSRWPRKIKNEQPHFQKTTFLQKPSHFLEILNFDQIFALSAMQKFDTDDTNIKMAEN